jgi:hypothetical protein
VDWGRRRLCPDGNCVGVLDAEGTCPVCSQVALAPGPYRDPPVEAVPTDEVDPDPTGDGDRDDPDEWSQRQLCEDGACLGVVVDGRCNTCGRAST